jgi:hypothetical protein
MIMGWGFDKKQHLSSITSSSTSHFRSLPKNCLSIKMTYTTPQGANPTNRVQGVQNPEGVQYLSTVAQRSDSQRNRLRTAELGPVRLVNIFSFTFTEFIFRRDEISPLYAERSVTVPNCSNDLFRDSLYASSTTMEAIRLVRSNTRLSPGTPQFASWLERHMSGFSTTPSSFKYLSSEFSVFLQKGSSPNRIILRLDMTGH